MKTVVRVVSLAFGICLTCFCAGADSEKELSLDEIIGMQADHFGPFGVISDSPSMKWAYVYRFIESTEGQASGVQYFVGIGLTREGGNWSGSLYYQSTKDGVIVDHKEIELSHQEAADFIEQVDRSELFDLYGAQRRRFVLAGGNTLMAQEISEHKTRSVIRSLATSNPASEVACFVRKLAYPKR